MFVWTLTLSLISLKLTTNIPHLDIEPFTPIILLLILCLIPNVYNFLNKSTCIIHPVKIDILVKIHSVSYVGCIILTIIDFLWSQGFPLLWYIIGSDKNYTNLGIPSVRGLQYTLYLMALSSLGIIRAKNKKYNNFKLIVLFALPILMFARGLLTYAIIQYLSSTYFYKKIHLKHIFLIIILIVAYIFIFGIIGDNRQGVENPFSYLISGDDSILRVLPSGFTWLYIYITAGFNNILITYNDIQPTHTFNLIFYNLIPGALKSLVFDDMNSQLITDASLNVASFFGSYYESFGLIGGFLGGSLLIFISIWFYRKIIKESEFYLIGYSACLSSLILSPFFDSLMTVSTIFQLVIVAIIGSNLKLNK